MRDIKTGSVLLVAVVISLVVGFIAGDKAGTMMATTRMETCILFSDRMWFMRMEEAIGYEFDNGNSHTFTSQDLNKLVGGCASRQRGILHPY